MDITTILNSKGPAAAIEQQLQQQLAQAAQANVRTSSDTGSEHGMSPQPSDHSSRYSSRSTQPLHSLGTLPNGMRYPSPSQMQQPISMLHNSYVPHSFGLDNNYLQAHPQQHQEQPLDQQDQQRLSGRQLGGDTMKAFACTSCGKGFARRSDLARHERIHSGIRPHVCDYPGCNKQFIQRSALTVHARVHTGEKPHMCERCGKPFSDSSSLARHRRIHSGKRPYKCPFADCQKTFTRRTTLTRHQNHHTGTVEEAAAATAAALASRPTGRSQRPRSDGGTYSDTGSGNSSPSPGERTMSLSPSTEAAQLAAMQRQPSDFSYLTPGSLPMHMRGDLQQASARSSPASSVQSLSAYGGSNQHRQAMTSHPIMYGPPPTLEPPTHQEHRQAGGSNSASPHMNSIGWISPVHPGMGSPGHSDAYIYPEPPYGAAAPHLYYPNSNIRRPQSTEPDQYETKPRMVGSEVWTAQI